MRKTEEEYLDKLFREMRGKLLIYANNHLVGIPYADDAVQEVFTIASLKIEALMASENPKGWLVNTLKNVIHAAKRSAAKQNLIQINMINTLAEEPNDQDLSKDAGISWIDLYYSGLIPDAEYRLIKMIEIEGYSIHEAAQFLSISDEACKKRIQRARAKLKSALDEMTD